VLTNAITLLSLNKDVGAIDRMFLDAMLDSQLRLTPSFEAAHD
jgi:hypothetical protein